MRSLTAPFNLREANILSLFTGFDGVQAFISIAFLIRANITLQGVAYDKNIVGGNKGERFSDLLSSDHLPSDRQEITISAKCHFVKFDISREIARELSRDNNRNTSHFKR